MNTTSTVPKLEPQIHSGIIVALENGLPIENAKVTVNRRLRDGDQATRTSELLTNKKGEFTFDITQTDLEHSIYLEFSVEHEDFAPRNDFGYSYEMLTTNESLGQPPFFSTIRLRPAATLTGQVVDQNGTPIANAKVSALWTIDDEDHSDSGYEKNVTTDSEGRFRVNVCASAIGYLWIDSSQHAIYQRRLTNVQSGDLGEIQLVQGHEVELHVTAPDGSLLAGIEVRCEDIAAKEACGTVIGTCVSRIGKTDKQGIVTFSGVRAGEQSLSVESTGHEQFEFYDKTIQVKDCDIPQTFEMTAEPCVTFSGTSVNSNGDPQNGHLPTFWIETEDGRQKHLECRRDGKGKFSAVIPTSTTSVEVSLMSSEHEAFIMEFGNVSTCESHLHKLEGASGKTPFNDLKITWFETTFLVVNVISSGKLVGLAAYYPGETNWIGNARFNYQKSNGKYRSNSIIPNRPLTLRIEYYDAQGEIVETAEQSIVMQEGETREITIEA